MKSAFGARFGSARVKKKGVPLAEPTAPLEQQEAPLLPEVPEVAEPSPGLPYGLEDKDYMEWKQALAACQKTPDSVEPLQALAARPKLLNWRSPVSGQTLLHEIASQGASEATIDAAVELGCKRFAPNAKGETAGMLARRSKQASVPDAGPGWQRKSRSLRSQLAPEGVPAVQSQARGSGAASRLAPPTLQSPAAASEPSIALQQQGLTAPSVPSQQQQQVQMQPMQQLQQQQQQQQQQQPQPQPLLQQVQQMLRPQPSVPSAVPAQVPQQKQQQQQRKAGKKLGMYEVSSVPKAQMKFDLDFAEEKDLDAKELERSIRMAYGGKASVQIDEVADAPDASPAAASAAGPCSRKQKVKARVWFQNEAECKAWQARSTTSRAVQDCIASEMQLNNSAVDFDAAAQVDSVDAVTLKLDSDSSQILCGACLLYNNQDKCEKVVCYSDRAFAGGSILHSGDTKVDGKSVHTIGVVMSKIPDEINQVYFTICSCGPADLSGFKNPSIMLYSNSAPDENLLEYSIDQAAKSVSSVMARMIRQPIWSKGDHNVIARVLRRKLRMPLLCIDLCLAMATESSFAIQALGSEEWHLTAKICNQYAPCMELIEKRLHDATEVNARRVSLNGNRGASNSSAAASSSAAVGSSAAASSSSGAGASTGSGAAPGVMYF